MADEVGKASVRVSTSKRARHRLQEVSTRRLARDGSSLAATALSFRLIGSSGRGAPETRRRLVDCLSGELLLERWLSRIPADGWGMHLVSL
uniref:Uncharacterized protein n=1 Tax=Oryza rufipogon TaxID=4529 RepID=A0A0E0PLN9_ORYRU